MAAAAWKVEAAEATAALKAEAALATAALKAEAAKATEDLQLAAAAQKVEHAKVAEFHERVCAEIRDLQRWMVFKVTFIQVRFCGLRVD